MSLDDRSSQDGLNDEEVPFFNSWNKGARNLRHAVYSRHSEGDSSGRINNMSEMSELHSGYHRGPKVYGPRVRVQWPQE